MASAITFPNDHDISYRFVDWAELGDHAYDLASKVLEGGKSYDRIIPLAVGGLALSRSLKDYLNISKLSSLQISFYAGVGLTKRTPIITQSFAANVQGEKILVFDDINDSGETVKTATHYLQMHGAESVSVATIFQKPTTHTPSDYYASETTDWIIFPDEIRETITYLHDKWHGQGLSDTEIKERLRSIGFTDKHVQLVLDHH